MNTSFPEYHRQMQALSRKLRTRIPETMAGFAKMHEAAMAPGVLDTKQKELIALAIGISSRCDGCIAFHTHEALSHGASPEEIAETIGVAILMGGGPVLMYGLHATQALEQFESEKAA